MTSTSLVWDPGSARHRARRDKAPASFGPGHHHSRLDVQHGRAFAAGLRRRSCHTGDKWHLDEVFFKINGGTNYLWRAVDQNGVVLDILVQPKRDRFAAMR